MTGEPWTTESPLFDPAEWLVMPNGAAVVRRNLIGPSGCCGATEWVLVKRLKDGREDMTIQCPKCMRLRDGQWVIGTVDRVDGVIRRL